MTLIRNLLLGVSLLALVRMSADDERMSPELLWKLGRLGGATVSADGKTVAYTVRSYELKDDKGTSSLFLRHLDQDGEVAIVKDWPSIGEVQFGSSPFGERLFFVGSRGLSDDEASQAWSLNPLDGGLLQITDIDDGVANLKVSPSGKHLAFTLEIKLDQEVTEIYEDLPKADARIIDSLMYRHWNGWHDFKYTHLHVAPVGDDGRAGEPVDLMEGLKANCPVPPFNGSEQFNWSPDGSEIAYTAKIVESWAESTDSDVYLVSVDDPKNAKNITKGMLGYDNNPVYSPDGSRIALHSMERPSFESDRNRIMVYDRKSHSLEDATAGLDRTAHGAVWTPDGEEILFTSETGGTDQLFKVAASGGDLQQISYGRFNWGLVALLPGGEKALVSVMNMERPKELAVMQLESGEIKKITDVNGEIYQNLALPTVEERWVEATDGKRIHSWVIYPPDFDKNKKWPLLTYCQGGPQGQIGQWFSYRWNFHLMAAQGYVVIAPNRRGLPGFGREWNDQISGDWGGQAMQDLLSATDSMLAEPYIDSTRTGAVGASFGGYSVYWLMGNDEGRFKTMIAHCGVFNLESMYGSTEELFFVNWDLGGPYWKSDQIQSDYNRFSPHRFVKNWKTPLMVIHGQKDFRVPVTQGMEAFTAAQVNKVPSRFLYFPNEGHWVMKPQNGVLWHRVFFDWLDRYCKPASE
jgi:dipeptidyl aminopeptidase/acylaminoacyl peptidase